MDFLSSWTSALNLEWISNHIFLILLSTFVGLQWIVMQAWMIHYWMNKSEVPTFKRERAQIENLERLVTYQANQIERIYAKLGELSREVTVNKTTISEPMAPIIENSTVSMGELSLKKRLAELTTSVDHRPKKVN